MEPLAVGVGVDVCVSMIGMGWYGIDILCFCIFKLLEVSKYNL